MKMKVLFALCSLVAMVACDKPAQENGGNNPVPNQPQYPTQTAQVAALIEQYWEYDITNVPTLIEGYWQLDARFKYDAEYKDITAIDTDFGTALWNGNSEDVLAFGQNLRFGRLNLDENSVMCEQEGSWQYDARTMSLTMECGGVATTANLAALGGGVLIVDYELEGDNLREIYKSVYYAELICREATLRIDALCGDCAENSVALTPSSVAGVWSLNSRVEYDDNMQNVVAPDLVFGVCNEEGGAYGTYTINDDGTGRYYCEYETPGVEPTDIAIKWSYDTDTQQLTLGTLATAKVVGFNGQYLILDYDNDRNEREVYRRKN